MTAGRLRRLWMVTLACVAALLPATAALAQEGGGNVQEGEAQVPVPAPTRAPSAPAPRPPAATATPPAVAPVPTATPTVATPSRGLSAKPPSRRSIGKASPEPSSRRLRRQVTPLAGCVSALNAGQERVILRRTGLRGFKGSTRTAVARRLRVSRARVARLERQALRTLRARDRAGRCKSKRAMPASDATPATASTGSGGSAGGDVGVATSARSYAGDHPGAFILALFATLLFAVLLVREVRRSL